MVKPTISVTIFIIINCLKLNTGNEINPTKSTKPASKESSSSADFELDSFHRPKRIIDGEISTIEEFPYLVYLHSKNSYHCAGVIISPHHVLTAAHCVYKTTNPKACYVRAGSSIWKDDAGSIHRVKNITKHPDFRIDIHDNSENDLAVLLLERPLVIDDKTVASIAMFDSGEEIRPGSIAKTAGWGDTHIGPDAYLSDQLRSINMTIVDKKNCTESYRDIDGIQAGEICAVAASEDKKNQSVCSGDSGGPLVVDGRLAGILTNTAENCSTLIYPNVMTEIAYFRKWIDQTIEDLGPEKTTRDTCSGWCSVFSMIVRLITLVLYK